MPEAFDLDEALREMLLAGASDLHLKVPSPPRVRVDGELRDIAGFAPLTPEDTEAIRARLLVDDVKREAFAERGSTDLSYYLPEGRFRATIFLQRNSTSLVFRAIQNAPDVDVLGLPDVLSTWADAVRGLVLVTGPTGSGKTTTCAALVDMINERRACHILTIEDPIEYLHVDRRSLVAQREIGADAPDYPTAMRAALRQDPDVVLVGEIRDEETALAALRAAETGHLVLSTMHTLNGAETVQRLCDLFGERSALARQMIAATLVGVVSQRLVPGREGGRVLNSEVVVNTSRVRDMIADDAPLKDVTKAIGEGEFYGMHTFDQDLLEHVRERRISREVALATATDPHDLRLQLASEGVDDPRPDVPAPPLGRSGLATPPRALLVRSAAARAAAARPRA